MRFLKLLLLNNETARNYKGRELARYQEVSPSPVSSSRHITRSVQI